MGAWGEGSFENDDAGDWAYELCESNDLLVLSNGLRRSIFEYLFLQAPKASVIVAAAETIASAKTGDYTRLPNDVQAWVRQNNSLNFAELKKPALSALRAVMRINCELRMLWYEDKEMGDQWASNISGLIKQLES
ncbi:hypothetical protein NBRC116494_37950 [Aurantivibrio plasticivorans]